MEEPDRHESIDRVPVCILEIQMLCGGMSVLLFRFSQSGADWERVQFGG